MRITVLGYTLSIGIPQFVLAGLTIILVTALITAGVTATTPFNAFNADWTGTSDLRKLADEENRSVFVPSDGTLPSETTPNETVLLMLGVGDMSNHTQQDLRQFVKHGGTIIVTADTSKHTNTLLKKLDATARIQDGPLRDPREYYRSPALPIVEPTGNSDTLNITQITLNHAGVVTPNSATVLAQTSEFAYIDTNRNKQFDSSESLHRRTVMTSEQVGSGQVFVISDSSVFVNAMLEREGNKELAMALVADHQTVVLSSYFSNNMVPPVANALLVLRRHPLLQMVTLLPLLGTVIAIRHYLEGNNASSGSDPVDIDDRNPKSTSPPRTNIDMLDRTEGFVRVLGQKHPKWDRQRLKRVVQSIIDQKDSNDE